MGGWKRHRRSERERSRGAALVEAAIVLPLLILLTFGIWTTARAWNVHNVLDHASREAARYGATSPDDSTGMMAAAEGIVVSASVPWAEITTRCAERVEGASSSPTEGTACFSDDTLDPTTDDRIQIELVYPDYELDFIFFHFDVDLTARAVSRVEKGT